MAAISNVIQSILLENQFKVTAYEKDKTIFKEGDKNRGVFYVTKGIVKITQNEKRSKEVVLWFARKGEFVGLRSLFNKKNNYSFSSIVVKNTCEVMFIPLDAFNILLAQHSLFKREVIAMLCERVKIAEERMGSFLSRNIKERVSDVLALFAKKKENSSHYYIDYSMKDLAEMVGASNGYLQKIIAELLNKEIIERKNRILLIKDIDKLKAYKFQG